MSPRSNRTGIVRLILPPVTVLLACGLFGAPVAMADDGENFGFAKVNQPGAPLIPAFPGTDAIWAGTCDLTDSETDDGGVDTEPSSVPPVRAHCMDVGNPLSAKSWVPGEEPRWRLDPVTQAAAHPDATANFFFQRDSKGFPDGNVKDIIAKLPPGVVGNPEAMAKCPAIAAQNIPPNCPPESQAGIATLQLSDIDGIVNLTHPVYNVEPRDTVTAEFLLAFVSATFNVPVTARGRTNSDYGVDTLALLIPTFIPLAGQSFTLWGVPWGEEHDRFRVDPVDYFSAGHRSIPLAGVEPADRHGHEPPWGPIQPFFTNPTECSGQRLPVEVDIDSWHDPVSAGGGYVTGVAETDVLTGCERLGFEPAIALRPDVRVADSPSGLDVELSIPQNNDPPSEALGNPDIAFDPDEDTGAPAYWKTDAGLATAHLEDTVVRLPAGTSFNPAAANGLRGCTTAQIGLTAVSPKITFDNEAHQCPEASKIGSLEIVSPLLPDPLEGAVYAAPQHDNPFPGALTAIYMVSQDEERGLSIKLAGKVDLDERTGQITTTFSDNPQLPFETFRLKFKSGPRAPLNTPAVCGQFKNSIDLKPWSFPHSGPVANIQDPFDIRRMPNGFSCVTASADRGFAPGFHAGSTFGQAGADTGFVLDVTRRDGEQEVAGIELELPEGLVARLAGTPYCPDSALAAIAHGRSGLDESRNSLCPAASWLGEVHTLAGAGPLPLPSDGRLYLAGPYAGAPLSVAAVVPAIAGGTAGEPAFDLGNVVVRSAAHVDPRTARVSVRSSSLPYIVGGVPLRVRRVSVEIAKPGFMRNPTDCSPMQVGSRIFAAGDPLVLGDESAATPVSSFQVGGCRALGFKPTLKLRLFGGVGRGEYQRLKAVLTARPGDANIGRAAVTMPRSAFLAQEHIRTVCTRVQWASDSCPKGAIYGRAVAWSPLLDQPLSGAVYLRSSDNDLPDVVADLRGPAHQPIRIELIGRTDSVKGALRNTFDIVPDAPVSRFELNLFGGRRGLIVNSRNVCRSKNRAKVNLLAQNGRRSLTRPAVVNPRCKKQRKPARRTRAGHRRGGRR